MSVRVEQDAPRPTQGNGFSDAVTVAFADGADTSTPPSALTATGSPRQKRMARPLAPPSASPRRATP